MHADLLPWFQCSGRVELPIVDEPRFFFPKDLQRLVPFGGAQFQCLTLRPDLLQDTAPFARPWAPCFDIRSRKRKGGQKKRG